MRADCCQPLRVGDGFSDVARTQVCHAQHAVAAAIGMQLLQIRCCILHVIGDAVGEHACRCRSERLMRECARLH